MSISYLLAKSVMHYVRSKFTIFVKYQLSIYIITALHVLSLEGTVFSLFVSPHLDRGGQVPHPADGDRGLPHS